jgi:putative DNA primase/helicase
VIKKPTPLVFQPYGLPVELRAGTRFVLWRYIWKNEQEKWTKPPYQRSGQLASTTDPETWITFNEALIALRAGGFDGIGRVLVPGDGEVGFDFDHCRDRESGEIDSDIRRHVERLDSYSEVSPSGTGLRVFARGDLPPEGRKKGGIEVYDSGRYLTLTGHRLSFVSDRVEERQEQISAVHAEVWPAREEAPPPSSGSPLDSDAELLARARTAQNGLRFADLYDHGSWESLGYPSYSEGEMALLMHLAFWTGRDADRMDRLFRGSALMRQKWDDRRGDSTFGNTRVSAAISATTEVYKPETFSVFDQSRPVRNPSSVWSDGDREAMPIFIWHTAAEIGRMTPEEVDWYAPGIIAPEAITELSAPIKAGKTTLLGSLFHSVLNGEPFLGQPTRKTAVVYLTEEKSPTFRSMLGRTGLLDHDDLLVMFRHEVPGVPWSRVIDEAILKACEVGAGILAVDTLSRWAGLTGDDENSAGAAMTAMEPVHIAAAAGLAVILNRHSRKGGGAIEEAGRGSSAFGGEVDILLQLRRSTNPGNSARRELIAVGRFDGIPDKQLIEFRNGQYVYLGDSASIERDDAKKWFREHLPGPGGKPMTKDAIKDALPSNISNSTVDRALTDLIETSEIDRKIGVVPDHPRAYGYWRTAEESAQNDVLTNEGVTPDIKVNQGAIPTNLSPKEDFTPQPPDINEEVERQAGQGDQGSESPSGRELFRGQSLNGEKSSLPPDGDDSLELPLDEKVSP